jgi:hypothetical protein
MAYVAIVISQPSLDFFPIWIPIISKEVGKLQHSSVWHSSFCLTTCVILCLSFCLSSPHLF